MDQPDVVPEAREGRVRRRGRGTGRGRSRGGRSSGQRRSSGPAHPVRQEGGGFRQPPGIRGLTRQPSLRGVGRGRGRGRGSRGGRVPAATVADAHQSVGGPVEDDTEDVSATRGTFTKELRMMMYGFGDSECPLQETVDVVEDCVVDYVTRVLHRLMDAHVDPTRSKVTVEDVIFQVRKDPRKVARARELLLMNEEVKRARKGFDTAVEDLVADLADGEGGERPTQENEGQGGDTFGEGPEEGPTQDQDPWDL